MADLDMDPLALWTPKGHDLHIQNMKSSVGPFNGDSPQISSNCPSAHWWWKTSSNWGSSFQICLKHEFVISVWLFVYHIYIYIIYMWWWIYMMKIYIYYKTTDFNRKWGPHLIHHQEVIATIFRWLNDLLPDGRFHGLAQIFPGRLTTALEKWLPNMEYNQQPWGYSGI